MAYIEANASDGIALTPSNALPATIINGETYTATANGKAVASLANLRPTNSSPDNITAGEIYYATGDGSAIGSYNTITPSDSSPAALSRGSFYKVDSNNGYAISTYTNKTPSSTPSYLSSGNIYKMSGGGYVVDDYNSITPSDSSPVSLSSGRMYRTSGSGYAIASQPTSKTPSDSSPPSISSGAIIKANAAGYLYSTNTAVVPSGTLAITSNGTHNVTNYANVSVAVNNGFTNLLASNYRNIGSTNEDPISIYSGSTPPKFIIYSQGRVNGDSVCCAVYDVFNNKGYYRKYTGGSWKTGTIGASNDYFTYYKSGATFYVTAYKYASGIQVKSVIYVF